MSHYTTLRGDVADVQEVVAQALFNAQFPLRTWNHTKDYLRKLYLKKAQKALTLSGFATAKLVKGES